MERGAITDKLGGQGSASKSIQVKLHSHGLEQPKETCSGYVHTSCLVFCLVRLATGGLLCVLRLQDAALRCVLLLLLFCVVCCAVLRCVAVMLRCPALPCLAPWLAKMHSALQLCYHRARRRFNASNCRMCMRGRKRRCWGCKWELLELEIKRKREMKVCVCVCVDERGIAIRSKGQAKLVLRSTMPMQAATRSDRQLAKHKSRRTTRHRA